MMGKIKGERMKPDNFMIRVTNRSYQANSKMQKNSLVAIVSLSLIGCSTVHSDQSADDLKHTLRLTREATVEISTIAGHGAGTGFFISDDAIITCFHVAAAISPMTNGVQWSIFQDLKVKTQTGEVFDAQVVSIPTRQDISPLVFDFAVLRLKARLPPIVHHLALASTNTLIEVGEEVFLSGYPLATPAMVSHKGMISGLTKDSEIICIEAPINKGNSGGALCMADGTVIGIVSMREVGISVGLDQLATYIETTSKQGSVVLMGVDPLQAIREVTLTLDRYISTGIGYARSIRHVQEYINGHPNLLK
jgi:S1-C subfamily serine protease